MRGDQNNSINTTIFQPVTFNVNHVTGLETNVELKTQIYSSTGALTPLWQLMFRFRNKTGQANDVFRVFDTGYRLQ